MKCSLCGKKLSDGDKVLLIGQYVTNSRRGDFIGGSDMRSGPFIHLTHLETLWKERDLSS